MRLNTNNTSFSGRYLLQGTPQEVNTAIKTIKSEKGDDVEFAFRDRAYIADYKQGVKVAQDVEGNILGFVFDDGRVMKFNKSGNLQQIIYPNGSVEYFHQDGRRYLTVHDNGEKEYRR